MFDDILQSPDWWRGLTRAQRLGGPMSLTEGHRDYGRRRREAWRGGHILRGTDISLDRWERQGLTEEALVELLAEPVEALAARLPERPRWLAVVADAWQRFGTTTLSDLGIEPLKAAGASPDERGDRDPREAREFLQLITPLLAWGRDELRQRIGRVCQSHGTTYAPPVGRPVFDLPVDRLMSMTAPVMVLEVNVARLEGRLAGTTSSQRMAAFVAQIGRPRTALGLLAEYPVLARELVASVLTAVEVTAEFADRFLADLPALREQFGGAWQSLSDVVAVKFGAGDTHRGGRTVAIVELADGAKVVYKPRSLRTEVHFNQLVEWLNARGLRHPLKPLRVLDRDDYGWVEHVSVATCQDERQVERFFWRHGAYLALFYALCGSDMHLENVIASGEHPVPVDLEAIFQVPPRLVTDLAAQLNLGDAPRAVQDSVLRIGLLPERIITADDDGIYDAEISGLAGAGGQLSPGRVPSFVDAGTDQMRMVRERKHIPETNNRVRLHDQPVNALGYTETLAAGFTECYDLLQTHRDELLAEGGPIDRFGRDEVRFIPRPTMTYGRVLLESWHPDLLRDSLDREIFFEVLSSGFADVPDRDLLLASEQRQLADQDVPSFHTTPDSVDLHDRFGVVAHDFLEMSGLQAVRARLRGLSAQDLDQQLWCVRASMTGLTIGTPRFVQPDSRALPTATLETDLAVHAAQTIGDLLLDAALAQPDQAPSWLSVNLVDDRFWRVGHAGLDLYSGISGIALFLAQLGQVTGSERYSLPAQRLAQQLSDVIRQIIARDRRGAGLPIGGFSELGGLVYVLGQLTRIWPEEELVETAHLAAAACAERVGDEPMLDVITGTAGAALAILALHQLHPREATLEALRAAGAALADRTIDVPGGTAWKVEFEESPPLLGFSHGASGMAYALAQIAELTGEQRYAQLCARALGFERHHLDGQRRNWPDLRTLSGPDAFMNAWCHGAAGIGLARAWLLGLPVMTPWQETLRDDLEVAVGRIHDDLVVDGRYVGVGNDSICHGDLGLVETMVAAGSALGRPELADLGLSCAKAIAEQVVAGAPRPGVPQAISTPGLLMGHAGIGYGLLRAALPALVPNVLLLTGPGMACPARYEPPAEQVRLIGHR